MHVDASACTAAHHAEEMTSNTRQPKSTNMYTDASIRTAAQRTKERTAQCVEDGLSSLRRSNGDGDLYLQEFDHEELVMTMEGDQKTGGLRRRRTPPVDTSAQHQVSRSSLLDPSIRELVEHPRGPLPNLSVRELAGFPKSSLSNAGIQELAEHPYQLVSKVLGFSSV